MKTIEKLMTVITNNMAYAIVLLIAVALFAIFSDGLISGLITAASAFVAFVAATLLYKEFQKADNSKSSAKKAAASDSKSVAKPAQKAKKKK